MSLNITVKCIQEHNPGKGKPLRATGCKCAVETDEYHGWECEITGGECMYLFPDSKACARDYGEGPNAIEDDLQNR